VLTIDHDSTGSASDIVTITFEGVAHTTNIEDMLLTEGNIVVI
jgi:hypothetical protein